MALFENFSTAFFTSFILLTLLVSVLAATVIPFVIETRRIVRLVNLIPGPKAHFIFGNALDLNVGPIELFQSLMSDKICNPKSSISRLWLGWSPKCVLYKAKSVEVILKSQKHIARSIDYALLEPWLGYSLLTSAGKEWHQRRKMLTPAFHFKILEDFVDVFNQQSLKLVSILHKKTDEKPFDVSPLVTLCTLDIILETAMGRHLNVQDNTDSPYVKALHDMSALFFLREYRPWLHYDFIFNLLGYEKQQDRYLRVLHGFTNQIIQERKEEFQEKKMKKVENAKEDSEDSAFNVQDKKRKRQAFLDLLLDCAEEYELSDEDIRAEVDTFMFAGHDTTAAAINWAIYLLGCHSEIQELVYEELFSIFGDSDRPVTTADFKEMKYLERCIKETLRIFPSAPQIARRLTEDVVIDGYTVPSGTTTYMYIYKLHRDPEHFPDPEVFDPDRFTAENSMERHPYAYVPFSAGPRNCIGQKFALMEQKIVLANLFRNFRIQSVVKREDLKLLAEVILRSGDGIVVKLILRKAQ